MRSGQPNASAYDLVGRSSQPNASSRAPTVDGSPHSLTIARNFDSLSVWLAEARIVSVVS
jgi:hypothetical protein